MTVTGRMNPLISRFERELTCWLRLLRNIYPVKPRIKLHSKSNSLRMAGNLIILFIMKVVLHSNDFRCGCFQRSEWYLTLSRKATSFIHTPHVQNLPTENYCQVRVFYTGHSPSLLERNCKELSFNGRFSVGVMVCSHCTDTDTDTDYYWTHFCLCRCRSRAVWMHH